MKKLLLSLGTEKAYNRALKGGLIISILISVSMCAMLLPGIFNR
ncbi:hypothetical protein [Paraburkholderia antibiotica]|nr:hypothetical protein [Paraburkholderia antibiotica]